MLAWLRFSQKYNTSSSDISAPSVSLVYPVYFGIYILKKKLNQSLHCFLAFCTEPECSMAVLKITVRYLQKLLFYFSLK